jgi:hypothetical protein
MTATLAARADVVEIGGPGSGLLGVAGIKYTTATQVATRALRCALGARLPRHGDGPAALAPPTPEAAVLTDGDAAAALPRPKLLEVIRTVARSEAAYDTGDFFERRTNWPFTARDPERLRAVVDEALGNERPVLDGGLSGRTR